MASWRYMWQSFDVAGVSHRLLRSDSSGAPPASDAGASTNQTYGDKIVLPPEVLEEIMRESPAGGNDESPLTFVLSGYGNTKAYSGVIEFTSPPGCVTLPPAVIDALGLSLADQVGFALQLCSSLSR